MNMDEVDLAGVGVGPFNLSIAALADEVPELRARLFERRERFAWHPGLMFEGSRMQTSFLKDLVTAVSPTNPHSFLNYLVSHGRFYSFLATEHAAIGRREFADYLGWVASRLESLSFADEVREVRSTRDGFELIHDRGRTRARCVVLGTGRVPSVPACARQHLGPRCFHAIDTLTRPLDLRGSKVAVVGGGQTGAELVLELLRGTWGEPARVTWASRRLNFEPLDESPFANHLFTPEFMAMFHGLEGARRESLLERHKLAGDGISLSTLRALHDRAYELGVSGSELRLDLLPARELIDVEARGSGGFELHLHNLLDETNEPVQADWVILCTGLREQLPGCVEPLLAELEFDAQRRPLVDRNFELRRPRRGNERLYIVNGGRSTHGIAESQLSLMAWRSAVILNDVLGRRRFDIERERGLIRWQAAPSWAARGEAC
ncbi:lysine N(6)-hydroxylase/L-ornithine N(5)-oxygenase family protein [Enhygromyxa salina]|uniref:L-lysine N6-monooxygenase n=1 Tax=Enhygromyxa salina TaxID=215803 RepID=A0A2S9YVB0_9BACT|nr:SidA/IucD/PvdA family monooxygenase [Enhygromyxa salina]PRQ09045.1 L-lysine N6-monooxygenase [Enhygromyxa salina]